MAIYKHPEEVGHDLSSFTLGGYWYGDIPSDTDMIMATVWIKIYSSTRKVNDAKIKETSVISIRINHYPNIPFNPVSADVCILTYGFIHVYKCPTSSNKPP